MIALIGHLLVIALIGHLHSHGIGHHESQGDCVSSVDGIYVW